MRYLLILIAFVFWPLAAIAQESEDDEDRGFIAGLLESALGGDGRTVQIIGFAGALSSTASIEQITIADDEGIWLTIDDVALTWKRSALLRGIIDVQELRATRIQLPRTPVAQPGVEVPDAEATPFALPDLPASILLEKLDIGAVELGAPVLGEAATLSLSGSATLADGAGDVSLRAQRSDGPRSTISIDASYANETRDLALDLEVTEDANGLLSGLMNLPGRPSVDLNIEGNGALSDFAGTLDLRTDDTPRLAGTLALQSEEDGPMDFEVDLGGDVTALFLPQYAAFFGPDVSLSAQGNQDSDGALTLSQFDLQARALELSGQVALNSDRWPILLDVKGQIADPSGTPILLPGASGAETRINSADLAVTFDTNDSDALTAQISIAGLDRAELTAEALTLDLDGTLSGDVDAIGSLSTRIDLAASGLGFTDPALTQAIGTIVRGGLDVQYADDAPLQLTNLSLTGAAWQASGSTTVKRLSEDFSTAFDLKLDTPDLSAFAALAGVELTGAGQIGVTGNAALGGFFDVAITGTTQDLALGIPQADAVLAGQTAVDLAARRDSTGTFLDRLTLNNPALSADVSANLQTGASEARYAFRLDDAGRVVETLDGPLSVEGTARQTGKAWDVGATLAGPLDASAKLDARIEGAQIDIDLDAGVPDLKPLVPQLEGGAQFAASAQQRNGAWDFDTEIDGPFDSAVTASGRFADGILNANYSGFLPSLDPFAPGIPGALNLNGEVQQVPDGYEFATNLSGPYDATVNATGALLAGILNAKYSANVPDVSTLAPGVTGALDVNGEVQQVPTGWEFVTDLSGPYDAQVNATGALLSGILSADYAARLPDVSALAPGINGAATLDGNVQQQADGWAFATDLTGPFESTGNVTGTYKSERLATDFEMAMPNVAPLAPGVSGPLNVAGTVAQVDQGWTVETDINGPYSSTANIDGTYSNDGAAARYEVQVPDVGALLSGFSGAAALSGTATQVARGFDVDATLEGPGGTTAQVQGLVGSSGELELDAKGQAQLGLVNTFIAPRSVSGTVDFDLTVDGPAAPSSVRGRISTSGTQFADPSLPLSFSDITASVDLSGEQANLGVTAQVREGGSIGVNGPITLDGAFPAQLEVGLNSVVVTDNVNYTSLLNGGISVNGPLLGGAQIAGTIDVGETTVRVPNSTVSTLGAIPDITHIGETRPQLRTRERAGLVTQDSDNDASGGGSSIAYPLDVKINLPSKVFVRGRGINAELGGDLQISGSSADVISIGQIDLIRGRIDVLNRRFDLTEGRVELEGRFEPFLRLVAETTTDTGTASIIVEGPLEDIEVSFESSPEAPQDQVLAQVIFGRDISQLSAFQALQLASAVANLAGVGGEGLVSQLRGSIGLDDLDITTNEDGSSALRAGKYLSDNVYTDVTVGGQDGAELSINIDLSDSLTVRGSVASDSNTSLGLFIEKDY